jgi:hypothetical protein
MKLYCNFKDGTCKTSCEGVTAICDCPFAYLNGGVQGLVPCRSITANVTQYTETVTRGVSPLLLQCAEITGVAVRSRNEAPWIRQCAKTEVRQITASSGEFVVFYLFIVVEVVFPCD